MVCTCNGKDPVDKCACGVWGGGLSPGTPPHLDFEPKISQTEARRVQKEGLGKAGCGSVDSGWEGATLGQLGPPLHCRQQHLQGGGGGWKRQGLNLKMVFLCRPPCCWQSPLFDGQPGQPPPSAVTPLSPAFLWPQKLGPELSRTVQEGTPQISSVEPFVFNLLRHSPKTSVSSVRKAVRFQVPFSGPSLLAPLETDSELPQSTTFLLFLLFLDSMSPFLSSLSLSLTLSSSSDASSRSPTTGTLGGGGGGGTGRGGGRGGTHHYPPGDTTLAAIRTPSLMLPNTP